MTEGTDTKKPELIVRLRRNKDGPVQQLNKSAIIPAIKRGKLLRSDEYSVDGISWSQLDHHPQLKIIFDEVDSTNQPPPPADNKTCEKCGYERKENEVTPDYECPKCGASDAKVEAPQQKDVELEEKQDSALTPPVAGGEREDETEEEDQSLHEQTAVTESVNPVRGNITCQVCKHVNSNSRTNCTRCGVFLTRRVATTSADTKVCPFCAETIKAAAIKCRFCGSDLKPVDFFNREEAEYLLCGGCGQTVRKDTAEKLGGLCTSCWKRKEPIQQNYEPGAWDILEGYLETNENMICPHCQQRGGVMTKQTNVRRGISGAKATGAVLTFGFSTLLTGLSGKEEQTQARCKNCSAEWFL